MSRAAASVRRAALSPCPHCGRETKTSTDGHCVECWAAKTAAAIELRPPPRTEPLLDVDIPWDYVVWGIVSLAAPVLIWVLIRWI